MKINEILTEDGGGLWANIRAKRERIKHGSGERMRKPGSKGAPTAANFKAAASESVAEDYNGEYDDEAGMAETNLHTIARAAKGLLDTIDDHENLPEWVQEKIAKVEGMMTSAWDYLESQEEQGIDPKLEETYHGDEFYEAYGDLWYDEESLNESEYHGHKVTLNKPFRTPDGPKKFSVYVKNEKGNVVKVNFGDPHMRIKKSIPGRRKSFRARHHCENPGPKTSARYWSCRKW